MSWRNKDRLKNAASGTQDGARPSQAAGKQRSTAAGGGGDGSMKQKLAQYAHSSPLTSPNLSPPELQAQTLLDVTTTEDSLHAGICDSPMSAAILHVSTPGLITEAADVTPEPTLRDVLQAVTLCHASISSLTLQLGTLKEDIGLVRQDIRRVSERTTEVETRVSDLEDRLEPMQRDVRRHNQLLAALEDKSDDLENRLRRNNVRLVGVPEKVEGSNPTEYFESWLRNTIGKDHLTPLFAVERAHRVPTRPLPPGAPPRSVLIRILHFRDRDIVLRRARELEDIRLDGSKIAFFPDFSINVQKKRAQFQDIKRRLRALGLSYAMMYPARLRVVADGKAHFFENPKDAMHWVDQEEAYLKRQAANLT